MTTAAPNRFQCISALEASALIQSETNITVFDVRDVASYQQGHVAGAMHLSEERLPLWFRRLSKEAPILIYCYHGNASKAYAEMFSDFRFSRVYSVDGGHGPLAGAIAAQAGPVVSAP